MEKAEASDGDSGSQGWGMREEGGRLKSGERMGNAERRDKGGNAGGSLQVDGVTV